MDDSTYNEAKLLKSKLNTLKTIENDLLNVVAKDWTLTIDANIKLKFNGFGNQTILINMAGSDYSHNLKKIFPDLNKNLNDLQSKFIKDIGYFLRDKRTQLQDKFSKL